MFSAVSFTTVRLFPGSIRFLHTHADQRQFTVGTLHINAGTFGLYHKAGFLQAVLVLVEYGGRNLNQAFRLFKQGLVPVSGDSTLSVERMSMYK